MKDNDRKDRRNTRRRKFNEAVSYINCSGALKNGRLVNLGGGGARLITDLDVQAGQNFLVLHKASLDVTLRSEVEVRWVKPLSGGCQVVGVRELRTSMVVRSV